MKLYEANNLKCSDISLNAIHCGQEHCLGGKSCGPYLRDSYIIHYIEKGTGIFELGGKRYAVNAGEIFFIPPNVMSYYEADTADPWVYKWVGIRADNIEDFFKAIGLGVQNPVMKGSFNISAIIDKIIIASETANSIEYTACTYSFFAELAKCGKSIGKRKTNGEIYAQKAAGYIDKNIYKKITVAGLASHINVDRSYLASVFKKHIGISPKQYIMEAKLKAACEYLKSTDYDITHIAQSVGYDDLFVFSHAFKKAFGISPKEYRDK